MTTLPHFHGYCAGKRIYLSAFTAHRALGHCLKHKTDRRHECRVYKCPACSGYHLSSSPKAAKGQKPDRQLGRGWAATATQADRTMRRSCLALAAGRSFLPQPRQSAGLVSP